MFRAQAHRGAPLTGVYSVLQCLKGLMGQPLYCSAADSGMWEEKGYGDGSTTLLPWLPGLPPQASPLPSLLPHIPLIHLSAVNSSPCPGIAPQSPNSSSQPLHPLRDLSPSRGMYGCGKNCLILILFRLSQISCFTVRLKCFFSDSDNCPDVGIRCLLQFPHPPRAGPVLLTLLFFPLVPSSYQVLRGSIYSFPLIRYSSML